MHASKVLILFLAYHISLSQGNCSDGSVEELMAISVEISYLTSPNYPNEYPANSDCEWRITAPSSKHRVQINVLDFEVEGACSFDNVKIYDGSSSSSRRIIELCGTDDPGAAIVSTGQSLFIVLSSDSSVQEKGFRFSYTSYSVLEACPPGWEQYGDECYKLMSNITDGWDASQVRCGYSASNLISIHTQQEELFLINTFKGQDSQVSFVWIGAKYSNLWSNISWIDRSVYNYTNWMSSEPQMGNGDCCAIDITTGQWRMKQCYYSHPSLCKKNIAGTTVVYLPESDSEHKGGYFRWNIPGIMIALIVISAVAYTILRHFCKCLGEMCECLCELCSSCQNSTGDDCSSMCKCDCGCCDRSKECLCVTAGSLATCAACCALVGFCRQKTGVFPRQTPDTSQQAEIVEQNRDVSQLEASMTSLRVGRHISSDYDDDFANSSSSSSISVVSTTQPQSVRFQPSSQHVYQQGPPPCYEDLNFENGGRGNSPAPTEVPDFPPPSYDDVTTAGTIDTRQLST